MEKAKFEYENYIDSNITAILFFYHADSLLCQTMRKDVDKLIKKYKYADFYFIDVTKQKSLVTSFGVTAVPTIIVHRNDLVLARLAGKLSYSKLLNFLEDGTNITQKITM